MLAGQVDCTLTDFGACALAAEQKKMLEIAAANAALNMDDLPETLMLGRSAALRQDYSAPEQATTLGR
jgi:hypothetical protein